MDIPVDQIRSYTFNWYPTTSGTYKFIFEVWIGNHETMRDYWDAGYIITIEEKGSLKAYVEDEDGWKVQGSTVKIYDDDWYYLGEKTTNSQGYASWSDLIPGDYNIESYSNNEVEVWASRTNIHVSGGNA